ncbi:MAG: hypothetical protein PUE08_03060, partial [Eubacteriales bacterium]|nr:hypothetical protein [Eubacteriales bacterium]
MSISKPTINASIRIPFRIIFALLSSIISFIMCGGLVYSFGDSNAKAKIDSIINSIESHVEGFANLIKRIGNTLNINFLSNADGDTILWIIIIIGLVGFVLSGGLFVGLRLYKEVCTFFFHINLGHPILQLIIFAVDLIVVLYGLYLVFALALVWSLYNTVDKIIL